jgi:DUF1365 family protein
MRTKPRLNSFLYNYAMVLYKADDSSSETDANYLRMCSQLSRSKYSIKDSYKDCDVYWLAEPGFFNYRFNPISFWYFIDRGGGMRIRSILALVSNTPWGEEILYELSVNSNEKLWKKMHVSPFNPPRDQYYLFQSNHSCNKSFDLTKIDWKLSLYGKDDSLVLIADMKLIQTKCPQIITFSFILIIIRIYWQAFLMWLRSFPYYEHKPIDSQ